MEVGGMGVIADERQECFNADFIECYLSFYFQAGLCLEAVPILGTAHAHRSGLIRDVGQFPCIQSVWEDRAELVTLQQNYAKGCPRSTLEGTARDSRRDFTARTS